MSYAVQNHFPVQDDYDRGGCISKRNDHIKRDITARMQAHYFYVYHKRVAIRAAIMQRRFHFSGCWRRKNCSFHSVGEFFRIKSSDE